RTARYLREIEARDLTISQLQARVADLEMEAATNTSSHCQHNAEHKIQAPTIADPEELKADNNNGNTVTIVELETDKACHSIALETGDEMLCKRQKLDNVDQV